jgi:hypothetical protein
MQIDVVKGREKSVMTDPKTSADAARKIQEIHRKIAGHESNIKRHSREIDVLRRQI